MGNTRNRNGRQGGRQSVYLTVCLIPETPWEKWVIDGYRMAATKGRRGQAFIRMLLAEGVRSLQARSIRVEAEDRAIAGWCHQDDSGKEDI